MDRLLQLPNRPRAVFAFRDVLAMGAPRCCQDRGLRVPEVIVLAEYDRLPQAAVSFSRRNIFKRDRWTCQYCGLQPGGSELTIDHVVPRAQGGQSTWDNCVLACEDCNMRKADRTPKQAKMKLLSEPKRPRWTPIYARESIRIASWSKFISEAYWNVELEK